MRCAWPSKSVRCLIETREDLLQLRISSLKMKEYLLLVATFFSES